FISLEYPIDDAAVKMKMLVQGRTNVRRHAAESHQDSQEIRLGSAPLRTAMIGLGSAIIAH
ncbi:MAG: hypothetical protein COW70_04945, partial [Hydrogenophilales bacterium CG18_big_fil_WC_8_21_14_2_50_58_12]